MKISVTITLFLLYIHAPSFSQLCSGNLGDPIINNTFGNTVHPLSKTQTDFAFTGGCPSKGEYTINSFLFGCGDHSWVAMTGDHTHDLNGNYMLVNGEATPGVVYRDTARNLCGNSTYQFAAWITNVMQDITCGGHATLPDIQFSVEDFAGNILATYSTGGLPITNSKEWKHFGVSFTNPNGNDAVIVKLSINPPPAGCGFGFAVDDITFNQCGPMVTALLDGSTNPGEVCADYTNPFILTGIYDPGFTDPVLQWQSSVDSGLHWTDIAGANGATYAIPRRDTGAVQYRLSIAERANAGSPYCRINSNIIYTGIHPVPLHNEPQSLLGCTGKDYALPAADAKSLKAEWLGPNGYNSQKAQSYVPDLQFRDTGLYTLKQTFYFNCVSFDSFYLKIYPGTVLSTETKYAFCEGGSAQFSVTASGGGSFEWSPSSGLSATDIPDPVAAPTDSTNYKVTVTNSYGCKDSAFIQVNVYRNPYVNAGPDKVLLNGDTTAMQPIITGTALNYYWSPPSYLSDPNNANTKVFPPSVTTYTLHAYSTVGCGSAADDLIVKVYDAFNVPNAFTPNGDGRNDVFRILPLDNYQLVHFDIYNRWGLRVFSAKDASSGWDGRFNGKLQEPGTYIFHVELNGPNTKKIVREGTILLIR